MQTVFKGNARLDKKKGLKVVPMDRPRRAGIKVHAVLKNIIHRIDLCTMQI